MVLSPDWTEGTACPRPMNCRRRAEPPDCHGEMRLMRLRMAAAVVAVLPLLGFGLAAQAQAVDKPHESIIDVGDLPGGIIDVGDLPDGIIDVGDLPDGYDGKGVRR